MVERGRPGREFSAAAAAVQSVSVSDQPLNEHTQTQSDCNKTRAKNQAQRGTKFFEAKHICTSTAAAAAARANEG